VRGDLEFDPSTSKGKHMQGNSVLELAFSPWSMYAVFAASRLRIFTLLRSRPMTVSELSQHLQADDKLLPALLDVCVAMGLLHRDRGGYVNSHLSESCLVEGAPLYLGNIIELQSIESATWQRLYDVVAGKGSAEQKLSPSQAEPRLFTLAMDDIARQGEAAALAAAVDLSACRTMVDVGCGSGAYSATLCLRNPSLRATLLDLPEVLDTTREVIQTYGLGDRIETKAVDMTSDAFGKSFDAVLLSDVLYQNKATCLTILRSAYKALASGGRLIVRGYYSDPGGSESLFGALFVVHLLLSDPSRDPLSVSALKSWVNEAGFKDLKIFALTERSTCLTAVK
jgi:SAM-dependent methyltransferase